MSIRDLVEAGEPPVELPVEQRAFDELLSAAEAEPLESMDIAVVIGDVEATLTITEVRGYEWCAISETMPRLGNLQDLQAGCDTDVLLQQYPVDRIVCANEHPSVEDWRRLCVLVDADARTDVVAALWWMHVGRYREARALVEQVIAKRGEADG